jgi:hypothetical protein
MLSCGLPPVLIRTNLIDKCCELIRDLIFVELDLRPACADRVVELANVRIGLGESLERRINVFACEGWVREERMKGLCGGSVGLEELDIPRGGLNLNERTLEVIERAEALREQALPIPPRAEMRERSFLPTELERGTRVGRALVNLRVEAINLGLGVVNGVLELQ